MCFDENLLSSEYLNSAILQGNDSKNLPSSDSLEDYVDQTYTAPQTPPFTEADLLQQLYQQLHTTPVTTYTVFHQTPVSNRKRSFDQFADESDLSQPSLFDQVSRQNPYLVHRLVMKTIHMEFAIEDQYTSGASQRSHLIRIRKRRKPQECEWKPESVYKSYVECKPPFFEKSDYQDFIPKSSCFGKINMRIPKAWTRKPNKPKKQATRETSHYNTVPVSTYGFKTKNPPSLLKTNSPTLDEILAFDFLFN